MKFEFCTSHKDYFQYQLAKTFGKRRWQRVLLVLIWIASTITFLLSIFDVIEVTEIIQLCSVLVMLSLPFAFATVCVYVNKFKKNYRYKSEEKRRIEIKENGVEFSTKGRNDRELILWKDFIRVVNYHCCILFYVSSEEGILLPKRFVKDPSTWQHLLCTLEANLHEKFQ